jgi:hypothetical protein
MSDTSFNSFFNNGFGLNVKGSGASLSQMGETLSKTAGGVFEPLFTYLEDNENVFSGDLTKELNKTRVANFNMNMIMNRVDEQTNGKKSKFDAKF